MTMMTVFLMTNPMSIMTKKTAISPSQNGSLNIRSSRETWFSHFDKSNKQSCDKNIFVLLWKNMNYDLYRKALTRIFHCSVESERGTFCPSISCRLILWEQRLPGNDSVRDEPWLDTIQWLETRLESFQAYTGCPKTVKLLYRILKALFGDQIFWPQVAQSGSNGPI